MTGKQRAQTIKQAITSLFQVTDLLMSSRDAAYQAEMREKQMAYGILLDSCYLRNMTGDAIARAVEAIKGSLHKSSKVRNSITYFYKLIYSRKSCYQVQYFPPSSVRSKALNMPGH